MKKSKKIIGIIVGIVVVIIMSVAFLTTKGNMNYYTQIDNRWVSEIAPHGAMNYKYTLDAYDEKGSKKGLVFETGKMLTDGAFLCLKVAPIRGVTSWAEVKYKELPPAVQEKYKK